MHCGFAENAVSIGSLTLRHVGMVFVIEGWIAVESVLVDVFPYVCYLVRLVLGSPLAAIFMKVPLD